MLTLSSQNFPIRRLKRLHKQNKQSSNNKNINSNKRTSKIQKFMHEPKIFIQLKLCK